MMRRRHRNRILAMAAISASLLVTGGSVTGASGPGPVVSSVALGDADAAGPLLPAQDDSARPHRRASARRWHPRSPDAWPRRYRIGVSATGGRATSATGGGRAANQRYR